MSRTSRASAAALAAALALPACREEAKPETPKPPPFQAPATAARAVVAEPLSLTFVDVTKESGVDFVHDTGADGRKLLPETMGSGCAWLDHDGDGDPDLLLLSGTKWRRTAEEESEATIRLFRNDGGWRFVEVTREAGLHPGRHAEQPYALGVACADTDGDGDTDVLVTGIDGYWFLRNDGGRFVHVAKAETGLDPGTWKDATGAEHGPFATSAAFLDYDRDGRADVFVCHYVHWSEQTDVWSSMDGRTKSYAIPTQYQGESCRLWRNLGGNRFEDVTDKAGVRNDEGKSLGVCVTDLDDDGWPDVVVANDTQPNYVYLNRRDGTFEECGVECGIAFDQKTGRARAGMGIDAGSVGRAGKLHVAIGNFSGEPCGVYLHSGAAFVNREDLLRIGEPTLPSLTFGVKWADVDLDGRTDLVAANGHIEPTVQAVHKDIPYRQALQVLRQGADEKFVDLGASVGEAVATPRVHRSCACADVDGDGDLDWVFTVNGGPAVLLRCDLADAAKRSLRVKVAGEAPATDALGARVVAEVEGLPAVTQRVTSGAGYLSESERVLTFGLGAAGKARRVTVRWPDGHERTWTDVPPGLLRAAR